MFQMRYGALWAPVIGYSGDGTDYKEILLNTGEYIATIEYSAGNLLDRVQFYSQTGIAQDLQSAETHLSRYCLFEHINSFNAVN